MNILDNNDLVWRYISPERYQILVKVEEDPNRQKIIAAMQAHSANINRITPTPMTSNEAHETTNDIHIQKMET